MGSLSAGFSVKILCYGVAQCWILHNKFSINYVYQYTEKILSIALQINNFLV